MKIKIKINYKKIGHKLGVFCKKLPCKKLPRLNIRSLIVVIMIVLVVYCLYLYRGQFIVATVNGKPISRYSLMRELETQNGERALDSLITKTLIAQEAKKQKVEVSGDEISKEIAQIEKQVASQNQNLESLLKQKGMTRKDLEQEMKLQILIEKLGAKDVAVSDQEVNDLFDQQKDTLPKDKSEADAKSQLRKQLEQQKKSEAIQTWFTQIRKNAKLNYLLFKPAPQTQPSQ